MLRVRHGRVCVQPVVEQDGGDIEALGDGGTAQQVEGNLEQVLTRIHGWPERVLSLVFCLSRCGEDVGARNRIPHPLRSGDLGRLGEERNQVAMPFRRIVAEGRERTALERDELERLDER